MVPRPPSRFHEGLPAEPGRSAFLYGASPWLAGVFTNTTDSRPYSRFSWVLFGIFSPRRPSAAAPPRTPQRSAAAAKRFNDPGCDHTRLLNDRPSARPSLTSQLAGRLRARNSAPGAALESFNPLTPALGNETYRKRRVFTVFER